MDRRLRLALLLAAALQAPLILAGRFRYTYDAYIHMFFANHYLENWWGLREPRWYTGFNVSSYPPLVHQLIAIMGSAAGFEAGFAVLLLVTLLLIPAAVYSFTRIFTGRTAAGYAALASAVLPSIYLSAFTYGQLPTLFSLAAVFFACAALAAYLRAGSTLDWALTVALFGVTAAAHHGTLLLVPWVVGAVSLQMLLTRRLTPARLAARLLLVLPIIGLAMLVVIWPFWAWGLGQTLQVPIDHPSRHNFMLDPGAMTLFFWPVYGPFLLLIPWIIRQALQPGWPAGAQGDCSRSRIWAPRRRLLAPFGLMTILFLLGLGGTTPLPRWLYGPDWAWLTYDRFSLWASIVLLPFAGLFLTVLRRRLASQRWRLKPVARQALFQRDVWLIACILVCAVFSLRAALLPSLLPTQPAPLDLQPVANYLNQAGRDHWRYLTFGFGDQSTRLSLLTEAATLDGSYHTARGLPELRSSGIGTIDAALWSPLGLKALDPILAASGSYGVRWGFVNRWEYELPLYKHSWRFVTALPNGVQVWENPAAAWQWSGGRMPGGLPPAGDPLTTTSWGLLPLFALGTAALLAGLRLRAARLRVAGDSVLRQALLGLHSLAVGLLPLGIAFWYFLPYQRIERPAIYFTYTSRLVYLSDGLVLLAVAAWSAAWLIQPRPLLAGRPRLLTLALAGLVTWAGASAFWSPDPAETAYTALHLFLLFGLFLSLMDQPRAWRALALGSLAVLLLESALALAQFILQSTTFMAPLRLLWPGSLNASLRGASVVELPNGARWLRAYGSLPHPNITAGFFLACLSGPLAVVLAAGPGQPVVRRLLRPAALVLFGLGSAALLLTFSRGALLGYLMGGGLLAALHLRRYLPGAPLHRLGAAAALGLLAAVVPSGRLLEVRFTVAPVSAEIRSIQDRRSQSEQAFQLLEIHPLTGTGAGAFLPAVEARFGQPAATLLEPVHNLPMLVAAELGLPGLALLLLALIGGLMSARMIIRPGEEIQPVFVALSACLLALLVAGLFDHYLWSLAPGRTLAFLFLGAWSAQLRSGTRLPAPAKGNIAKG